MRAVRAAVTAVICVVLAGCGSGARGSGAAPAGQVAARADEVSFVVGGTTTYGTLEVPAHRGDQHLAAALLLAGSGPTDRNGNQEPNLTPNTLGQIADALDRVGIMSLRFDKYFSGKTGAGAFAKDPGSADLNASVAQAEAAYQFLRGQAATDTRRLLVVGHSEGGMFAILVAEAVSPHPAGLALVEPQDERLLDLLAVQINEGLETQVSQGAISADTARGNAQGVRQAIGQFRAGRPVDTTGLLPAVAGVLAPIIQNPANAREARTVDAVDPATVAAKLPAGIRVLVTDGTADTNVPPFTIQPLVKGLTGAGVTGPGLQTLDGLNHDLVRADTQSNGAPLDPAFLTVLRGWAQPYATQP